METWQCIVSRRTQIASLLFESSEELGFLRRAIELYVVRESQRLLA